LNCICYFSPVPYDIFTKAAGNIEDDAETSIAQEDDDILLDSTNGEEASKEENDEEEPQ
jgi:hypothetical protein